MMGLDPLLFSWIATLCCSQTFLVQTHLILNRLSPLVCSFQVSHQWYRSTGSQYQHCMYRSSLDSDPEDTERRDARKEYWSKWDTEQKINRITTSIFNNVFVILYSIMSGLFALYLSVSSAGVTLQVSKITGGVLQTEAGLVSLCHFTASTDLQQIVMAELIHTVIMPVRTNINARYRCGQATSWWAAKAIILF